MAAHAAAHADAATDAPATDAPAPDRAWSPGAVATALPAGAADEVLAAPAPSLAQHLEARPVVRPSAGAGDRSASPAADRGRGPPVPAGT